MPDGSFEPPLALGLDLGTSALKAVLLDATGRVLRTTDAPLDTVNTLPGQAEQDVAQWISAAGRAVRALKQSLGGSDRDWATQVRVIGLAGQLPTLVVLGEHGPLGRAITWKDSRADTTAAAVVGERRSALYRATGMPIDGRYLAPMFRHHWLSRRSEICRLLSAKDYLCLALTETEATDPSTAAGYAVYDLAAGAFSRELCALWDLPPAVLPDIRPSQSIAGILIPSAAEALGLAPGLPVTVGAADSVSSALAMGSLERPGRVCVAMGSSTIIIDAVREPRLDPHLRYLLGPHVEPGWYAREMDLLATGTGRRWLSELLGWPSGALERHAANSPVGARGVTFSPYLAGGEQGALWNPALRGSLLGLTLETRASDLARAFMEGAAFEIRRCIDVLQQGRAVTEVVLAGHHSKDPFGMQMLANILNRPILAFPDLSPAGIGAAFGALRTLFPELRPRIPLPGPRPVMPNDEQGAYDLAYARYLSVSAT